MAVTASQKRLTDHAGQSLDLLYLLGAIGEKHHLILIHRRDGKIIEAMDYTDPLLLALRAEMGAPETLGEALSTPVRVKWAQSSDGDLMVELIADRVTLRRDPRGNYQILNGTENANTNADIKSSPNPNTTSRTNSPAISTTATAAISSTPALALFY